MSTPPTRRGIVRGIEGIGRPALGSRQVRRRITGRPARLVPAHSCCSGTVDPRTPLTADHVSVALLPEAAGAAARTEYPVDGVLEIRGTGLARGVRERARYRHRR